MRYGVADVPTTVVNGRPAVVGPYAEEPYVRAILGAVEPHVAR